MLKKALLETKFVFSKFSLSIDEAKKWLEDAYNLTVNKKGD